MDWWGVCLTTACSLSEEDDEKSDSEDGDLDKQMGNLNGEEADKLDERLWGDDEEDDEDSDGKAEETGPGMDEVIKSLGPRVSRPCSLLLVFFFYLGFLSYLMFRASSSMT